MFVYSFPVLVKRKPKADVVDDMFNKSLPKVKFDSPFKVFAVPEPVISLLSALLFIVVDVILDS